MEQNMTQYHAPQGGLPPQSTLHTGRAVFTNSYAVIPKGCFSDIVTSLTPDSTSEQASAALDTLTETERSQFQRLNTDYTTKHGFPFIIAVRDHTKASILAAFQSRIANDTEVEFETACRQVERIAELRLKGGLP